SIEEEIERWQHYHTKLSDDFRARFRGVVGNKEKIQALPNRERKRFEATQRDVVAEQSRVDAKILELRQRQKKLDENRLRDDHAVIEVRNGAPANCRFVVRGREYSSGDQPLPTGRTICINGETGRVHAVPTGLLTSSQLFAE
ncbi:MAG: hypothetical protein AAF488_11540, partial [Planctomycetota bacterium]